MPCLSAPWRLISFLKDKRKRGASEYNGIKKEIDLRLIKNQEIGDFFLLERNFAVKKVSPKEAKEILAIFENQFQKILHARI